MSVAILKSPVGHLITDFTVNDALISNDDNSALFSDPYHGLVSGDWIYIYQGPRQYLGFWEVFQQSDLSFRLRQYIGGPFAPYYATLSGSLTLLYYKAKTQSLWMAVNNPILYALRSNMFPKNEVIPTQTVVSFSAAPSMSGNTEIVLSDEITLFNLDKIRITGADDPRVNGIWPVIQAPDYTHIEINLIYDATYDFDNGIVQKEFQNYNIIVRVYAGLPSSHVLRSIKPSTLICELKFVPDSNNQVAFSISDILKHNIETINDILSISIPNDLAAFTGFYIAIADYYDGVDAGDNFFPVQSSFVNDGPTKYAVNASMPFKNRYSGNMGEYLPIVSGKFLSSFANPTIFGSHYFDVSFIRTGEDQDLVLRKTFYKKGIQQTTVDQSFTNRDEGVYRGELFGISCNFDRVDLSLLSGLLLPPLSTWVNLNTDPGFPQWATGSVPVVATGIPANDAARLIFYSDFIQPNTVYTFTFNATRNNPWTASLALYDEHKNFITPVGQTNQSFTGSGTSSGTVNITTGSQKPYYIAFNARAGASLAATVSLASISVTQNSMALVSEIKTFNINCECSKYELYIGWLNSLGGWDYWRFDDAQDHQIDITGADIVRNNLLPTWPNSFGEFADTIDKNTNRIAKNQLIIRAGGLSKENVQAIGQIKTSSLVQIINSKYHRRTIMIDTQSFRVFADVDKTHSISFTATYTDDIPNQSV